MAPESRNKSSNPIQRLLETEEKGRGLALFGWAGVTVFAFLAAFASWQFAPARAVPHVARLEETSAGDITGGIKPTARPPGTRTANPPTPLPGDTPLSRDDVEQLRADLKDLRRMVGRIDVSTDVLARRISNLEDSVGTGQSASVKPALKPLQALTPITPPMPAASATSIPAPAPPASAASTPSPSNTASATTTPAPAPAPPVATTSPSVAPSPAQSPQPVASVPQAVSVVPQNAPQTRSLATLPPRPPAATDPQADKTQFDRSAADRSQLERMLLQRAQGVDPDNNSEASTYIPPLPDPISVVPKTRTPLVLPPQPLPAQSPAQPPIAPVAKADPKPATPDAVTTGSVSQKPVLPIDPTKAVVVPQPVTPPVAAEMSPEDQKKASEKMALAMRDEQTAAAKPPEPMGIDLGGYKSIGQVKKVWSDLEIRQGKLAKALTPLARLGEANDGVEIRLIVGPFLDKEQAIRTCHQLRGATAKCDTVAYAGESIQSKPTTQAAPEAEHKPTAPEFAKRPPLKLDLPNKPVPPTAPTP